MKHLTILALALAAFATPSLAQDAECYSNDNYFVVARPYAESAGTEFMVAAKTSADEEPACDFDAVDGLKIGGDEDPLWYSDLQGNHLVLTRSTGPQGDLLVYDLSDEALVLDVPADEFTVDGEGVVYWERTAEGNADNCPDFAEHQGMDLGSAIISETAFSFSDETPEPTGETRCVSTQ